MSAVDVTELARDSVAVLSAAGPVALVATCAALAVVVATPRGRSAWMLGRHGLHGRRPNARRQLLMGLAIPLIAVTATSVARYGGSGQRQRGGDRDRTRGRRDPQQASEGPWRDRDRVPGRDVERAVRPRR